MAVVVVVVGLDDGVLGASVVAGPTSVVVVRSEVVAAIVGTGASDDVAEISELSPPEPHELSPIAVAAKTETARRGFIREQYPEWRN